MEKEISEITRRKIMDFFAMGNFHWSGALLEGEFLARLYDLSNMGSKDHRFSDAAGDIHQHRDSWRDWDDNWVFTDDRFNLLWGPDKEFLRFLAETVHPVVRRDKEEASNIVDSINEILRADGWQLVESGTISEHTIYAPRRIGERIEVFEESTGWQKVERQMQEAKMRFDEARNEEQYQAVGLLCREVLISLSAEVYDSTRHKPTGDVEPSETDAKRRLEAFIACELAGGSNEEVRKHAKAALSLANALQHRRTADRRTAALCCEATTSVVNIVAIISGRRD